MNHWFSAARSRSLISSLLSSPEAYRKPHKRYQVRLTLKESERRREGVLQALLRLRRQLVVLGDARLEEGDELLAIHATVLELQRHFVFHLRRDQTQIIPYANSPAMRGRRLRPDAATLRAGGRPG